ncbi:hypothetical protein H8356DRAFT_1321637 [Neocallimastix lanati (nom. inval.)]|nr:hypothetical protein H8356DRAFT_1321637 [Neocallimastix sp. JGI-2020a]
MNNYNYNKFDNNISIIGKERIYNGLLIRISTYFVTNTNQLKFNLVIDKNYFNSILNIKINIRNIKELETKGKLLTRTTTYVKINLIGQLDNEILDFKDIQI